jgi:dihydropteroate synthase
MAPPQPAMYWAGLNLDRPRVMGILNVTPDSFSDGGRRTSLQAAIDAGLAMAEAGADIIDVGGESTRPGASPVPSELEMERVLPTVRALAAAGLIVSIDTRHADTMRQAITAGARIVNDVSALEDDPRSAGVVAELDCPVVLMHRRGDATTMSARAVYQDVVAEVKAELSVRINAAINAGIQPRRIAIDPGIGFAKQATHSLEVLRGLPHFGDLGYPILVGASRKSFIGRLTGEPQADRRLGGSLAVGLFAVLKGASILRVHDVEDTVQALRLWQRLFE